MKKIFKGAVSALALVGALGLASCSNDEELAEEISGKIIVSQDNTTVTKNFPVASTIKIDGKTYPVEWSSSSKIVSFKTVEGESTTTATLCYAVSSSMTLEDANSSTYVVPVETVKITSTVKIGKKEFKNDFTVKVPQVSYEEVGNAAIASLGIASYVPSKVEYELPESIKLDTYRVAAEMSYNLKESSIAQIKDGKLIIDASQAGGIVDFDIVASVGGSTVSKSLQIICGELPGIKTVKTLNDCNIGDYVFFTGVVTKIYNATYGNVYFKDKADTAENPTTFYSYGFYSYAGKYSEAYVEGKSNVVSDAVRYDKWSSKNKFEVGDEFIAYGYVGEYKGNKQIVNAILLYKF